MDSTFWLIQYTDRPAGMAKPIHRDMRGEMMSMVLLVELAAAFWLCLLTALVFIIIRENSRPDPADTMGMRNNPMWAQSTTSQVQNCHWGIWARFRPRKLKLITRAPSATAWTALMLSGVMRDAR